MTEMARPRDRAAWAVIDWMAQQPGEFTVKDAYAVYVKSGGEGSITNFHTLVGKLTAKPWKDDQEKYALSDKRPLVVVNQGSRGQGNPTTMKWGLDHPLREPVADDPEFDDARDDLSSGEEDDPVGDALDRLERGMDRMPLKAALQRWRNMGDINRIIDDIKKEIPARLRMDAVRVATANLFAKGKIDKGDVEDAEQAVKGGLPTKSSQKSADDIDIDDPLAGDWEEVEMEPEDDEQPDEDEPQEMQPEPKAPTPPPAPPKRDEPKFELPPMAKPVQKSPPPTPNPVDKSKLMQAPTPGRTFGLSKIKKDQK